MLWDNNVLFHFVSQCQVEGPYWDSKQMASLSVCLSLPWDATLDFLLHLQRKLLFACTYLELSLFCGKGGKEGITMQEPTLGWS